MEVQVRPASTSSTASTQGRRLIDRRAFLLAVSAGTVAMPVLTRAVPAPTMPRIGVLWPGGGPPSSPRMESFQQGLAEGGFVDGRNAAVVVRYAEGRDRLRDLASELVRSNVSVLTTFGDLGLQLSQEFSSSVPTVVAADDFFGSERSGALIGPRTIAGLSIFAPELSAKRLELLKELLPRLSRVAVLSDVAGTTQLKATQPAATALHVKLHVHDIRGQDDLRPAVASARKEHAEALLLFSSPVLSTLHRNIITLAADAHLPAIYQWREHAQAGGLISYGPSLAGIWHQTALVVVKVLQGARPADLPVEQPTQFEIVVNIRTARALGLTVPPSLLVRANEVIQ
jgi:putative ABC transport system substrate-binding protein